MHSGRIQAGDDPQVVRAGKLDLVERLADDLAHEIKNPLHSMVINLEVLKRRIGRPGGSEPEELLRYVGVLGSELDRVNRRVELLLRLIRPDRGGAAPTTLAGLLEELLELLELERERRRVTLQYEPSPVPVRGHLPLDPSRQLVLSLLVEAVDLVPSGGSVRVRTEVDPPWARLRIDGATADPDAAAAAASLQEELSSRLGVARVLADGLGGHLEVSSASVEPHLASPEPILSLALSLPLALSAS